MKLYGDRSNSRVLKLQGERCFCPGGVDTFSTALEPLGRFDSDEYLSGLHNLVMLNVNYKGNPGEERRVGAVFNDCLTFIKKCILRVNI